MRCEVTGRCLCALRENSIQSSINRCIRSLKVFLNNHSKAANKAMQLTKLPVVVFVLIARICRAKIGIAAPSMDESTSSLVKDLVSIVASCYGDRIDGIGLAGDLPDTLLKTLSTQHLIPVALIDNVTKYTDEVHHVAVKFRRKLHVFIVEASSWDQITTTIQRNIKYSIWWNHMASFFILDRSPECRSAELYLYAAWRLNILNAKVVCYRLQRGRIIINYNPFTSQAPVPWQRFDALPRLVKHPFTLFYREYRENEAICLDLDFDKTKDLKGYAIRVDGTKLGSLVRTKKYESSYNFWITHDRILYAVYGALNVTPIFTGFHSLAVLNNITDIKTIPRWILYTWEHGALITYPHTLSGFVLISNFRGHKSQLDKILGVIDANSRLGMGVVYLITLIFFKFLVGQALILAMLNIIRITCNTGFTNLPHNTASRIYLTSLLFFAITMQGIYQGNLASLLTTKIPLRNVDTIKDLVDLGYKVYGLRTSKILLEHPDLQQRFIGVDGVEACITHASHDSSAACIAFGVGTALDLARELQMHVSGDFIVPMYLAFAIRWDWPLEQRFNIIIAKLVEADVLEPWDVKCKPTNLTEYKFDQEVMNNKAFKKIELDELIFAFIILGIGLVCATITFIGELAIHRYISRVVNVRVQILN